MKYSDKKIMFPLLLGGLLLAPDMQAASVYTVTPLKTLAGIAAFETTVTGITADGQVVGYTNRPVSGGGLPLAQAVLWQSGSTSAIDLGPQAVYGVNAKGQMVGVNINDYPALWEPGATTPIALGLLPGGSYGWANGINAGGQVVGTTATTNNSGYHAALWQAGSTKAIDLGTLGGVDCCGDNVAADINNSGEIVGSATTVTGEIHAAFWHSGSTKAIDLGTLGGKASASNFNVVSRAFAINDSGQAVGYSLANDGYVHAVLWKGSQLTDLGAGPGNGDNQALDINAGGQMVGFYSFLKGTATTYAALWPAGSKTAINLNTLVTLPSSLFLMRATSISDSGEITALQSDGSFVLLTPSSQCQ